MRRPFPLLAAVLLTASLLAALPGTASAEPVPIVPGPRIVGGLQAGTNQFPWTAAVIRRSASTRQAGFECGATVLSRSWALTAGHCVLDYFDDYPDSRYGNYVGPDFLSVLTGTNSLAQDGGGQRLNVARIYPHPNFNPNYLTYDFALLRLTAPTSAPAIAVIGTSAAERALDDPGTLQTTIGWGITSESATTVPILQRYVQVPMQSDATCSNAYPIGRTDGGTPLEYHASSELCAGPLSGGKDSCSGDSGGPLAIQAGDGSWRQTGVVSFGFGCAVANNPGIYSRLTAASSWINTTRRFGPFNADGVGFIVRQYLDFTGKNPTGANLSHWLDKLKTDTPASLIDAFENGAAWQDTAAMVTRLYSAAFLRNPDANGLAHWINTRRGGKGPVSIANYFTTSSEFRGRYGSLTNPQYIDRIYQNIFGRNADSNGLAYWGDRLAQGATRGQMLYELSNSNEYRTKTSGKVRVITTRFALLRQVPTASEITESLAMSQRALIDSLRTSFRYAARFTS